MTKKRRNRLKRKVEERGNGRTAKSWLRPSGVSAPSAMCEEVQTVRFVLVSWDILHGECFSFFVHCPCSDKYIHTEKHVQPCRAEKDREEKGRKKKVASFIQLVGTLCHIFSKVHTHPHTKSMLKEKEATVLYELYILEQRHMQQRLTETAVERNMRSEGDRAGGNTSYLSHCKCSELISSLPQWAPLLSLSRTCSCCWTP